MEENIKKVDKDFENNSHFKNGVFFFNQKSERMFYFILMIAMLAYGLLVKIGIL